MGESSFDKSLASAETKAAFGAVEKSQYESTYKRLFKQFARDANNIAKTVSDSNPEFVRLTVNEVKSAHMSNDVRGTTSTNLNEAAMDIQSNLDSLEYIVKTKKIEFTKQRLQVYSEKYKPLKNDLEQKMALRDELEKELLDYLKGMRAKFIEVAQAIQADKPKAEIDNMLNEVERKRNDLAVKIVQYKKSVETLLPSLRELAIESKSTVASYLPSGTLTPEQRQQLKT